MKCDLHTHSNYSDGSFTPEEIVAEAKKKGLAVALTDHNTTLGLARFTEEARRLGVTAVAGVELTTTYKGHELHLLGLFLGEEHYGEIEKLVEEFRVLKEISNVQMLMRLHSAGYIIDYTAVKKRNATGSVNRAHFGAELMEKGYISSVKEGFDTLLKEGNGFYIPPERLDIIDAIRFLKGIRAVPVLAHPLLGFEEALLRELLPLAIEAGLVGMETAHSAFTEEQAELAQKTALEFGLIPGGGSDFHGENKPGIEMGVGKGNLDIPYSVYENLLAASKR